MIAAFDQTAGIEHKNEIGIADCREAMRDDDGGACRLQQIEYAAHGRLVGGVDMQGRFVEDEDRCILEEGSGDVGALALAGTLRRRG